MVGRWVVVVGDGDGGLGVTLPYKIRIIGF